jgi:hypothetical protein
VSATREKMLAMREVLEDDLYKQTDAKPPAPYTRQYENPPGNVSVAMGPLADGKVACRVVINDRKPHVSHNADAEWLDGVLP